VVLFLNLKFVIRQAHTPHGELLLCIIDSAFAQNRKFRTHAGMQGKNDRKLQSLPAKTNI